MTGRIGCVVPGCRRTRGDRKGDPLQPGMEWICGEHWALVDRSLKRLRARSRRRWDRRIALAKRAGARFLEESSRSATPGSHAYLDLTPLYASASKLRHAEDARRRILGWIWERMKRQAIERAAGL